MVKDKTLIYIFIQNYHVNKKKQQFHFPELERIRKNYLFFNTQI